MKLRGYFSGVPRLIDVEEIQPGKYLTKEAAEAWRKLESAAKAAGFVLHVNTAWRSLDHQRRLWARWESDKSKHLKPSRPGWSKQHEGIAVDLNRAEGDPDGSGPKTSPLDDWLAAHAREFGWVMPHEKEPWHWEYRVG